MENVNGDGEAAVQRQPAEMFPVETRTAKNLFIVGFFFLPFVWLLNYGINRSLLKNPDTPQKLRTCTFISFHSIFSDEFDLYFFLFTKS